MAKTLYDKGDIVHNNDGDVGVATSNLAFLVMRKHRENTTGSLMQVISSHTASDFAPMLPKDRAALSREQKVAIDAALLALDVQPVFNLKTLSTKSEI